MTNRLFGVLYVFAGLWLALAWFAVSRFEPDPGSQLFLTALLGLGPLAIIAIIKYVTTGRL